MINDWPEGKTMAVLCPNCNVPLDVQIAVVREGDHPLRSADCDSCLAEFELHSDGTTVLISEPPQKITAKGLDLSNRTVFFDPNGGVHSPNITAVEILLGGVGRLMFPDGTEQFVDDDDEPVHIYSPRLLPKELEKFCEKNLDRYQSFNDKHEEQLADYERIPMEAFW